MKLSPSAITCFTRLIKQSLVRKGDDNSLVVLSAIKAVGHTLILRDARGLPGKVTGSRIWVKPDGTVMGAKQVGLQTAVAS